MHTMKIVLIIFCLALPLFAAEETEDNLIKLTPEQIADGQISLLQASPTKLRETFSVPAKITINEQKQSVIVAKAPGIVAKIHKNMGDQVAAGEIIAVMESKEIAESKAAYLTALKRKNLAEKTLATEDALKEKKITSEQSYLQALLAAEEARINLGIAEQELHLLGLNDRDVQELAQNELQGLCCYEIKAPSSGVIISKNISLGSLVSADQEVYKIADLDTVWVELNVYSKHMPHIKPSSKIYVSSFLDEGADEAEIMYVSPIIDDHTRSGTAIAILPNHSRQWYPGSYVRAEVIAKEYEVPLAVLKDSVHEIEGKHILFISHPEGFKKQEVTLGRSDGKYVEILSGANENISYAATNTFLLKAEDGKKDAEL